MKNSTNASVLSTAVKVFQLAASVGGDSGSNSISEVARNSRLTSCFCDFGSDAQALLCTAIRKLNDSVRGIQLYVPLLNPVNQVCLIPNACLERLVKNCYKKRRAGVPSFLGTSYTYTNSVSLISFCSPFTSNSYFLHLFMY